MNTLQNGHLDIIFVYLSIQTGKRAQFCTRALYRCLCEWLHASGRVCAHRKPYRIELFFCVVTLIQIFMSAPLILPDVYMTCSACQLVCRWVDHVTQYNCAHLPQMQDIRLDRFPNRHYLTFSSSFYSLTKMSIDFRHSFCHSKLVFI